MVKVIADLRKNRTLSRNIPRLRVTFQYHGPWFSRQPHEEIIPLVIHDNKRGKVFHFDLADGLHAKILKVDEFYLLDIVLGEYRRRPADAPQVEPAMRLARV